MAIVALLVAYGGIRSPDAEVMFGTAERLAYAGTFAHERDLEDWPNFGLPRGLDGRRYQWFGPGQSLYESLFVPLAHWLGESLARVAPTLNPPPSHFFQGGLKHASRGRPVSQVHLAGHLSRSVMSLLDVLTLTLTAFVLHRIFLSALVDATAAGWCTIATVLGTPLLNYATTLFSEPLATLFCALALLQVIRGDRDLAPPGSKVDLRLRRAVIAGVTVSIAVAAHITALLFIPLLVTYAWRNTRIAAGGSWRLYDSPGSRRDSGNAACYRVGMLSELAALRQSIRDRSQRDARILGPRFRRAVDWTLWPHALPGQGSSVVCASLLSRCRNGHRRLE